MKVHRRTRERELWMPERRHDRTQIKTFPMNSNVSSLIHKSRWFLLRERASKTTTTITTTIKVYYYYYYYYYHHHHSLQRVYTSCFPFQLPAQRSPPLPFCRRHAAEWKLRLARYAKPTAANTNQQPTKLGDKRSESEETGRWLINWEQ